MRVKVVELRNNRGDVRWAVWEYDDYGRMGLSTGRRYRSKRRAERAAESHRLTLKWYEDKAYHIVEES